MDFATFNEKVGEVSERFLATGTDGDEFEVVIETPDGDLIRAAMIEISPISAQVRIRLNRDDWDDAIGE